MTMRTLLSAVVLGCLIGSAAPAAKRNVVLYVVDDQGLDAVAQIFDRLQAGYFDTYRSAGGLVKTVKRMFDQAKVNAHRRRKRQADRRATTLNRPEVGALVEDTRPHAEANILAVEAVVKFYVEKQGKDVLYQHEVLDRTYDELAKTTEQRARGRKRPYSISGIRKKAERQRERFLSLLVTEWAAFEDFCQENGYPDSVVSYVAGVVGGV